VKPLNLETVAVLQPYCCPAALRGHCVAVGDVFDGATKGSQLSTTDTDHRCGEQLSGRNLQPRGKR
jgi:hypothetical protein